MLINFSVHLRLHHTITIHHSTGIIHGALRPPHHVPGPHVGHGHLILHASGGRQHLKVLRHDNRTLIILLLGLLRGQFSLARNKRLDLCEKDERKLMGIWEF